MAVKLPSRSEGRRAHLRGQDDAIAGKDRDANPWDPNDADSIGATLALCWMRGYNYGRQIYMQAKYGDIPTA